MTFNKMTFRKITLNRITNARMNLYRMLSVKIGRITLTQDYNIV
jgi:hypothetical protein